jgi:ABC-2 type transport system permease protein
MIAALSSEWLKIRTTRTIFWLLFALAAIVTLFTVAGILTSDRESLAEAKTQLDMVGIGVLSILIALIMGLIVSTGEFRHGTITPTLLSTPSRPLVVLSKAITAMLLGVTLVALAEALVIAEMTALLQLRGIDFVLDGGDAARGIGKVLAASAIWAAIGGALGLALRNQIGTFVGCFAWLFFAEPLMNGILQSNAIDSNAGRFFPLSATGSILNSAKDNSTNHMLTQWMGLTALCGWLALTTILALVLLGRRDVS